MDDRAGNSSLVGRAASFARESLRDNEVDFTREPVPGALGLPAIPVMLEMAMEAISAVVDIAFVSGLGTDAVAAVGQNLGAGHPDRVEEST